MLLVTVARPPLFTGTQTEDMGEILPMAQDFKVGAHVEWNSEAGRVRGTTLPGYRRWYGTLLTTIPVRYSRAVFSRKMG
jgi:hypothetical protein